MKILRNFMPAVSIALAVVATPLLVATVVYAQVLEPAPNTNVPVGQHLLGWLQPYITELLVYGAAAIVGWVGVLYVKLTGKKLEANDREALQTALRNAAGSVIFRFTEPMQAWSIDVRHQYIADAVRDYVLPAVPGAVARFGLGPEALREKVAAWVPQLLLGKVGTEPTVAPPVSR